MAVPAAVAAGSPRGDGALSLGPPEILESEACWRIAADTGVLDVNSRYAYALWCRDFAATSVVARLDGEVIGFVTGYRRPDRPATLFVWQVAVAAIARGRGVAAAMLDSLFDHVPDIDHLETTISPDNAASMALFTAFAGRQDAEVARSELFGHDVLGADHQPEILFRIGPLTQG